MACIAVLVALISLSAHRASGHGSDGPPAPRPLTAQDAARLDGIEQVVLEAVQKKELPGAVVLVGRGDDVVYQKAFGNRALVPATEAMTLDTIFDLASLTKVVATTTAVMMLVEEGRVRLNDPVARFIPEFGRYGKDRVTIRHLLTHMSGLRPDLDLEAEFTGSDTAIARASDETLVAAPGEKFIYSDINFFLLGEIVARVSGESLDRVAITKIFEPLGMRDTMFNPPPALSSRIAPTEACTPLGWPCQSPSASMLRGTVHDPTARRMGGVAGHAGLFSTATDLAIFCRMLLGGGKVGAVRILSSPTVTRMTSPATPPDSRDVRGLGWDIDSAFSANRGDLFPIGSFGHTGFTGTSIWIEPASRVFVIFLSNRVHPDGKGDVSALRGKVATIAASVFADVSAPGARSLRWNGADFVPAPPLRASVPSPVATGLDVLESDGFAPFRGKRVGLLTNRTGRSRSGVSIVDLLHNATGVTLVSLFTPEHGLDAQVDEPVASSKDAHTGLPIHSLYGDARRPTPAMLQGLDVIVIDLQDAGSRFYTFGATMLYMMEEASRLKIPVTVLDRPNPIDGISIEGPLPDAEAIGFNAVFPMPIRHGLTIGELARLLNVEKKIGADLTVVPMKNWRRDQWFDETGLQWTNPSPNMRTVMQAGIYPGLGAFEGTNLSVGRGTDAPFEQVGAPWIEGTRLAEALNERMLPGVRFYPISFVPATGSKFGDEICDGVRVLVTDRTAFRPVRTGVELASVLVRLYGKTFELEKAAMLFGSRADLARLRAGDDPAAIAKSWATGEAQWRSLRAKYLLYY